MDKDLVLKMKELVQLARQNGKLVPVSEAFELYPVEEEAHEGKIEYWESRGVLYEV